MEIYVSRYGYLTDLPHEGMLAVVDPGQALATVVRSQKHVLQSLLHQPRLEDIVGDHLFKERILVGYHSNYLVSR